MATFTPGVRLDEYIKLMDMSYVGEYLGKPIFDTPEYIRYGDCYFLKDIIKKRMCHMLADCLGEEIEVLDISIVSYPALKSMPHFRLDIYGQSAAEDQFFMRSCRIGFLSRREMGIVFYNDGITPRVMCIEGDDEAIYLIPPTHLIPFTDVELSELLFGEG